MATPFSHKLVSALGCRQLSAALGARDQKIEEEMKDLYSCFLNFEMALKRGRYCNYSLMKRPANEILKK